MTIHDLRARFHAHPPRPVRVYIRKNGTLGATTRSVPWGCVSIATVHDSCPMNALRGVKRTLAGISTLVIAAAKERSCDLCA